VGQIGFEEEAKVEEEEQEGARRGCSPPWVTAGALQRLRAGEVVSMVMARSVGENGRNSAVQG
jgi:hypothetical protein